ncbi:hypothetical protein KAW44_06175 [Candidatus Bipolaricaulota bacterium]|nr:hypothetical protein [Candidatus Bipolaricaulota bacterium]
MTKRSISVILLILAIMCGVALADEFDPATDGWYFSNWTEVSPNCVGSCDFSWDLYRQTYLGINPTHDCVEAPLDCAYYEIFKNSAEGGNCGGISLLALALFKYGGYMGFCSPANFYTGTEGPDRDDLHQAINILQARQFSAAGIENFLDLVGAGDLNNAERAFKEVKECLAKGDYPVLSIANSFYGSDAHTVIPYRVEENPAGYPPGTKVMHIWDSNHPYDDDPDHYADWNPANRLVISGMYTWTYTSGSTAYSGSGSDAAWCFCIPMSKVLHKSRQPMALDLVFDALLTVFISGPSGTATVQIADDKGQRLFKPANGQDPSEREWETDESMRLQGAFRWPWGTTKSEGANTPELFFIMRSEDEASPLTFTISGSRYKTLFSIAGNLFQIGSESDITATDVVRLSGTAANPSLEIATLGEKEREFSIRSLRTGDNPGDWRSVNITHLVVKPSAPVTITALDNLHALEISSPGREVRFDLAVTQKVDEMAITRSFEELMTATGRSLRIAPED